MELVKYLGKLVHVTLDNNFYYTGHVVGADVNSITLIDKKQQLVSLSKNSITTIREVRE